MASTFIAELLGEDGANREAASVEEIRGYRLAELVEDFDVRVRLRNSIAAAAADGSLPLETIGDYVDAGPNASLLLLRDVKNFGRTTAVELDNLIYSFFGGQRPPLRPESVPESSKSDDWARYLEVLGTEKLCDLARDELLSARLAAVLEAPPFGQLTLAEVVADFSRTSADMLARPNCGRRSVSEFRALCRRHVNRRLVDAGFEDASAITDALLGPNPDHAQDASGNVTIGSAGGADPFDVPDHGSLHERLDWLLAELDPRSRRILERRNGIGQDGYETLEEIGADLRVTRERVRQIESKSLRRLKLRVRRAPLRALILAEASSHWQQLTGGSVRLLKAELGDARRRMDPYLSLACDVEALSLEALLGLIAQPMVYGWLAAEFDAVAVEAAARLLPQPGAVPLPYPVKTLVGDSSQAVLLLATELVVNCSLLHGYLMPQRVGSRLTRMVRLHCMLAEAGEVVDLADMVGRYRYLFADDPCSVRDAEIVMDAAPHLFLELCDGAWSAINAGGDTFGTVESSAPALPQREEDGTIAAALRQTLAQRGPTRLADLMDESAAILPEGRSVNSIGPVLLMRPDLFVRALPGVYGLPDQIVQLRQSMPEAWPILFNDTQARYYALARYAGEEQNIFPLWSPRVEQALCQWARHSGGPGTLESLLAIADLGSWQLSSSQNEDWSQLKRKAHFVAGSSLRQTAAYQRPDLDRVFAACLYAAQRGTISWCSANRLNGRKLDSHGGAGIIAVLLALGAIEEISQDGYRWQRPHRATVQAQKLSARFEASFKLAASVPDWDSPLGTELIDEVRKSEHLTSSWVIHDLLVNMFDADQDPPLPESDDPLEQLLQAQRRARELERRQATLDWLLEE